MISKQGSTCTTTGVPVIEGDGRTVFPESCLSRQPQGGAAHIHMTVHLTVTGGGRRFRSTCERQASCPTFSTRHDSHRSINSCCGQRKHARESRLMFQSHLILVRRTASTSCVASLWGPFFGQHCLSGRSGVSPAMNYSSI